MKWSLRLIVLCKKLTLSLLFVALLIKNSYAIVYVYEVATNNRRFLTSSIKDPITFLSFNGGKDLIINLKVVKVYADNDIKKAIEDFNLDKYNKKELLPKNYPAYNNFEPYIWWK